MRDLRPMRFQIVFVIAILCAKVDAAEQAVTYQNGVVAADHPAASEAGAEILRKGGNVVDAAVATSFALSVVRPESCGIGGGGFMVIWNAREGRAIAIDYRERAPLAVTRDMFAKQVDADDSLDVLSRTGHLATAVPGTVAGLCYALERYGSLDLKTVLAPAIRLAREGVAVDAHAKQSQAGALKLFAKQPQAAEKYKTLRDQYLNGGREWKEGDLFRSPQARVLELIAEKGSQAFYSGPVAEAIIAESRRGGGIFTADDFMKMKPVERPALTGKFDGRSIYTMPPPSSGGIAILETLNILDAYAQRVPVDAPAKLKLNSPRYVHVMTEAMKHAFADRATFLGDTDFVDVPVERLLSTDHAARLAAKIQLERTLSTDEYGRFAPSQDAGTSHFSIIDRDGNAVACTETINTSYGSFVVEPTFGILLNNEMDDFAAVPGQPNAFGLIQSEANAITPGKKPLSSMSPTIVVEDGKAVFAVGASGGPMIISATLQVLLDLDWHEMQPQAAVAAARFHHQWLPEFLYLEPPLLDGIAEPLSKLGHIVKRRSKIAAAQAASRAADGELSGGSDPRKGGHPAGY